MGRRRQEMYEPGYQYEAPRKHFWTRGKIRLGGLALTVGLLGWGGYEGANYVSDAIHAKDYYASKWFESDAWPIAAWGKAVAQASQDSGIAVDASVGNENITVNVFQDGIQQNGQDAFPFTPVHGLPYAVMLIVSQGNPDLVVPNSTGGLFPLPNVDNAKQPIGPRLASEMGIDDNPHDPVVSTKLWMRYFNELTAGLCQSYDEKKHLAAATTPQEKRRIIVTDAMAVYFDSLGHPASPEELKTLWAFIDAQDQPSFGLLKTLLQDPNNVKIKANIDKADQKITTGSYDIIPKNKA